jgi:hypothetical protein
MLGEEAREVLLGSSGAIGKAGVVLVVELVRASHCGGEPLWLAHLGVSDRGLHRDEILTVDVDDGEKSRGKVFDRVDLRSSFGVIWGRLEQKLVGFTQAMAGG